MKILIAYDGSNCSEAALDDLTSAGLPAQAEVLIVTVAEVWLPKKFSNGNQRAASPNNGEDENSFFGRNCDQYMCKDSEAGAFAKHAVKRLKIYFPEWKISSVVAVGSPAKEIICRAHDFRADLIVAGSHGRASFGGRIYLGSVSQKILSEAPCSVRVARGRVEVDLVPPTVVIAYDGSPGANRAVEAVIKRSWREGSEFHLVAVGDQVAPAAIERFVSPVAHWVENEVRSEHEWLEKIAAPALEKLRAAGFAATLEIRAGNPKQIIANEAARLHANSIFVGATCCGKTIGKFLLGSVSAAIAARAHCSVEIVRYKPERD